MKTLLWIPMLAMIISCNSPLGVKDNLKGKWELTNSKFLDQTKGDNLSGDYVLEIRFEDSLFFIDQESIYRHSFNARWSVHDSTIEIIFNDILGADTLYWEVKRLTRNELELEFEDKVGFFKKRMNVVHIGG